MIEVGIIGGAGYTAGELIRLLINHDNVKINFVYSTSNAGKLISDIHQDLTGVIQQKFTNTINPDIDVVFLCLGHGHSKSFLKTHQFSNDTRIIDLSHDFRLNESKSFGQETFVYGLPEINKTDIKQAKYIANPGCFATALQLAILPLAKNKLLDNDIHINAVTGATGAGTTLSKTTHFTWRDNNFSHYKSFTHQHLDEINQNIVSFHPHFDHQLYFIPNRGNFSRGIFATLYTDFKGSLEDAYVLYSEFYKDAAFTFITKNDVHLKQVVNTNHCLINLNKFENKLLITSAIDNLLKGASGQAIQNMNLMFNLPESKGLKLKANYF